MRCFLLIAGTILVLSSTSGWAQEPVNAPDSASSSEDVPGEIGASLLEEHGLGAELFYTVDTFANVAGGNRRTTEMLGNIDLTLTADMEHLLGWTGGTLFLYGLGNHGDSLSEAVGDLQIVSNIEAPETLKLYEAWYEQVLFDENLSILFGLYDVNGEFDVIPAASLFVNSAHGMGSEFGNSGKNGPSTFPVTSLALRVQTHPTDNVYFRAVVADGVPGDLDEPQRTQVTLDPDDGLLLAAELGFYNLPSAELRGRTRFLKEEPEPAERQYGDFGKFAVGVWGYTTEFDDFFRVDGSGNPIQNTGSMGIYALAEQRVFYEEGAPTDGLSLFARAGVADDRTNIFDHYFGFGLVYRGLAQGQGEDRLGLAVAAARLGDDYRTGIRSTGTDVDEWEVTFELTYRVRVLPFLSLQPDIQYVTNPGGNPDLDDALVVGLRAVLFF